MPIISLIRKSADKLLTNWRYHPALYLIDLAFITAFIGSFIYLQMRIISDLELMNRMVMEELGRMVSGPIQESGLSPDIFNQMMGANPEISTIFTGIILSFFLLIFLSFLLWNLLQGINWAISHHITGITKNPFRYWFRFLAINSFWFIIAMGILYVWFNLTFYNMKSFVPIINQTLLNWVMGILIMMVTYFVVISYVLAVRATFWKSIVSSLKKGSEQVAELLVIFLLSVGGVLFSLIVVYLLLGISMIAALIGFLFIFIPMLSYVRVFTAVSVSEIVHRDR